MEIRNKQGELDEIIAHNANIHLEQMDHNHWWMGIEVDGKRWMVNFHSKTAIEVIVGKD